jgi:hypothetical protein
MPEEPSSKRTEVTSRDFFAPGTFATLGGATAAVVIITNTVSAVVGDHPKWLPLVIAMLCSLAAYAYAVRKKGADLMSTPRFLRYPLIVLNGCLIYLTAFGVQSTAISEIASNRSNDSEAQIYTLTTWRPILSTSGSRPKRIVFDGPPLPRPP